MRVIQYQDTIFSIEDLVEPEQIGLLVKQVVDTALSKNAMSKVKLYTMQWKSYQG